MWSSRLLGGRLIRDPAKVLGLKIEAQKLFLAGTVGALFFSVALNAPVHFRELSWPPDWSYTFSVGTRYLIVVYFIAYLLVAVRDNDIEDDTHDVFSVLFDAFQSCAILATAFSIGFVLPDRGLGEAGPIVAIAAVGVISFASALVFESGKRARPRYWWPENNPVQRIRVLAAGTAFLLFLFCRVVPTNEVRLFSVVVLIVPLCAYLILRISTPEAAAQDLGECAAMQSESGDGTTQKCR